MGVPFLLSLAITYTAGAIILMPFQLVFAVYDTGVFLKKAAKYTSKGIVYIQRYRANQRHINNVKRVPCVPVSHGNDWIIMNPTVHSNSSQKMVHNPDPNQRICTDAILMLDTK